MKLESTTRSEKFVESHFVVVGGGGVFVVVVVVVVVGPLRLSSFLATKTFPSFSHASRGHWPEQIIFHRYKLAASVERPSKVPVREQL